MVKIGKDIARKPPVEKVARARARAFFQDGVILPGGSHGKLKHNKQT